MPFIIEELATDENFNEEGYELANPDVARAIRENRLRSAKEHFDFHGKNEGRKLIRVELLREAKKLKRERLTDLLRGDMPKANHELFIDFLTPELSEQYRIVATDNVSAHPYGREVLDLLDKYSEGLVLDCGAGKREIFYENVVNFEIVDYPSTDVRGVAEELPFKNESFDAVISVAVLEHLKDPFRAANELARVLKPGGELFCAVPLLQPLHGYPHHYYNMTHQGLRSLFEERLEIIKQEVPASVLPIWSLNWILRSWAEGLSEETRRSFLQLSIEDLLGEPDTYLDKNYVTELSEEKNFELACATVLFAVKR